MLLNKSMVGRREGEITLLHVLIIVYITTAKITLLHVLIIVCHIQQHAAQIICKKKDFFVCCHPNVADSKF